MIMSERWSGFTDVTFSQLNWSQLRKASVIAAMCSYTLSVGNASAAIYSVFGQISTETGLSLDELNAGTGYMSVRPSIPTMANRLPERTDQTLQVPRVWLGMSAVAASGFAVRQKAYISAEPPRNDCDASLDAICHSKLTLDTEQSVARLLWCADRVALSDQYRRRPLPAQTRAVYRLIHTIARWKQHSGALLRWPRVGEADVEVGAVLGLDSVCLQLCRVPASHGRDELRPRAGREEGNRA